jgi:2-polyprenyl-3-methyl-5-hydroxy-6-metoxy-1,4-benzoquinol methylase
MDKNQLLHRVAQTEEKTGYAGAMELWVNEANLQRYNKDIVQKLSMYTKAGDRVLEFGAGIGTLAKIWTNEKGIKPICLEIDPSLQAILQERGFTCHGCLGEIEGQFDLIYSSNVLEHIEDDQKALEQLYQKLKPGGILTLYLPAFQCLYSNFDAAIGHYRRYEKAELMTKIKNAYFIIQRCEYADSIGFFAWMTTKNKKYGQVTKQNNDGQLKFYDRFILPVSTILDMLGMKYIFGKNLFVIALKKKN